MRLVRSLLIYFILVFLGGALLAPWLYWLALALAAHSHIFAKLASNPFHRFVDRSLLGMALLGIWPLLRSVRMAHWSDLVLTAKAEGPREAALGFLLGFGSLAGVALLAVCLGGRTFTAPHSAAQIIGRVLSAALTAIIVAVLEEILFRGTLFGILRKVQPWPMALLISSGVYALAHFIQKSTAPEPITWASGVALLPHMFQPGPNFIPAALTLFAAGVILALAYQRTGTLFMSIGLHAGWIFWLKSYGFLTASAPHSNSLIWGTDRLIDGWLALPILGCVLVFVWRIKPARENLLSNK